MKLPAEIRAMAKEAGNVLDDTLVLGQCFAGLLEVAGCDGLDVEQIGGTELVFPFRVDPEVLELEHRIENVGRLRW